MQNYLPSSSIRSIRPIAITAHPPILSPMNHQPLTILLSPFASIPPYPLRASSAVCFPRSTAECPS